MAEAEKLREYIARKQRQIEDLEKKYGTGVRPGWVGEEITMLTFYMQDAKDQLAAMEASNATDNSNH
jgi:hypothetical protein